MRFQRRIDPRHPERCGCPLTPSECVNPADGEDRLCSNCRDDHRPDFQPAGDPSVIDNDAEYV